MKNLKISLELYMKLNSNNYYDFTDWMYLI